MATLVSDLNELLVRERGVAEALGTFRDEIAGSDPDIAETVDDLLQTALWACSGLYHRINQLGGTPALDTVDLAQRMCDQPDTQSRLELICGEQNSDKARVKQILARDDLDDTTSEFLRTMIGLLDDTSNWCGFTLSQWEVDV
jgi:hypothetical protein